MAKQISLELIGHSLCPFTQRVLYVASYKKIQYEFTEIDLCHKPKWFLALFPDAKMPALKVFMDGQQINLYDSEPLGEYFDSFPGSYLYPRNELGLIDPLKKAQIDMIVKSKIDAFYNNVSSFWKGKATEIQVKQAQASLKEFNTMLSDGYLMTHLLKKNQITIADIMLLPFIERVNALRNEYWHDLIRGLDLTHLWRWYEDLIRQEWAVKTLANPKRIRKIQKDIRKGEYKGLKLPLTYYDSN